MMEHACREDISKWRVVNKVACLSTLTFALLKIIVVLKFLSPELSIAQINDTNNDKNHFKSYTSITRQK